MDEMKTYECPECGVVKKVAADAVPPTCEDCGITMEPVAVGVEEDAEELVVDSGLDEEEDDDEDLM